ncbi:hypothetical protein ZIOFF_050376 [Zingiber officinale]|uniref:C2H2-type domain-containing protein n=1 Tax=Zingiber officinale TaxID=94328 RepID=A0A8J5FK56_ZINOF|nr:hypothetical protein ZIOFF_050376 [Zingiber officinale]
MQAEDLLATSRYVCTVCDKGFQRDQNLQLHMRTHNVNYELKKSGRTPSRRKFYVCPIPSCVYSHRSRALSDITGIKKHFNRKHGPKNLRCPQCTKTYAVEADLKAHLKNHSLRHFRCKCGGTFSRKNSYEAHIMLCSESSEEEEEEEEEEGVEMPTLTDVGESSAAAYRGRAFNENSSLPDMNEHVECPVGIINDEVAPLGAPTMAEQHPSENRQTNRDQDAREQMNRFLSLLPDDPNLLPVRFTDLLNGRYDEIIGSVYGSGVDGRPAPPAPSGASHPVPPPASSPDGLREQNGSYDGFISGSSFSLMNPTEKSQGFGSKNHSLTNMCLYGTGEETSVQANSTVKNDFLGITSASLMEAGKKKKSYPSTASPMLGSLPFMNNNISQQFQAPGFSESSYSTGLQQKGVPLSGLDMNAPMNLFQAQQQEQALPPAPVQSFLDPMANPKLVPGITNPFFHQPQEKNQSDVSQGAFSFHRRESGNISSNKSPAPSFLYDFAHSTDSNSRQKGKAPIDYTNYFLGSSMAPANFPLGNPNQPFMDPFTLSSNIGPGDGRMIEMGGQNKTKPTDTMPPPLMRQNGEEVFVDGVTMDLLGLREGGGQFHQAEAANSILPANDGGEEQMGRFFGGADGYPRRFW